MAWMMWMMPLHIDKKKPDDCNDDECRSMNVRSYSSYDITLTMKSTFLV